MTKPQTAGRVAKMVLTIAGIVLVAGGTFGQSGRQTASERGKQVLHVIAESDGSGTSRTVRKDDFDYFEGGAPQTIESLELDPSAASIALVVDNTKTLKLGLDQLKEAARAIVNELYEGDKMMVVGYDESPYILQEFTTNLDALDATAESKFQKTGAPHLFDALAAIVTDAFSGIATEKRIIVLVSDGYDSGSKTKFDEIVTTLQRENIVVYVLEAPDRTRNASRLEGPKPKQAVARLTEATGGRVFPLAESARAAKLITEELRLNWFRAVYTPRGVDRLQDRNLLIIRHETSGPTLRIKSALPGRRANS